MARWSAVESHVTRRFQVVDRQPDRLVVHWSWKDGRAQKVELGLRQAFGREILWLHSPFARRDEVDLQEILGLNRELPFATVALDGDHYKVVYNALLRNMDLDEVEFCMARVAAVADTLEEQLLHQDVH